PGARRRSQGNSGPRGRERGNNPPPRGWMVRGGGGYNASAGEAALPPTSPPAGETAGKCWTRALQWAIMRVLKRDSEHGLLRTTAGMRPASPPRDNDVCLARLAQGRRQGRPERLRGRVRRGPRRRGPPPDRPEGLGVVGEGPHRGAAAGRVAGGRAVV